MRTATIALLAVAVASLLLAPAASAQDAACEELLTDDDAAAQPGEQLADAIGDQREEIGTRLNDRWFDARLANATSNRSEAEIIAGEVRRVENRLVTLERCWSDAQAAAETNDTVDEPAPQDGDAFRRQARSLHRRVNETEIAAARLHASLREANDVDEERLVALERQIVVLRDDLARAESASTTPGG